jgi:hypothetical protein
MPTDKAQGRALTLQSLGTDQATAALGVLATKHLALHGVVSFYTALDGTIQVALPGEVTLDGIPETMAIQELTAKGYSQEDLVEYLKGRDARMGRV